MARKGNGSSSNDNEYPQIPMVLADPTRGEFSPDCRVAYSKDAERYAEARGRRDRRNYDVYAKFDGVAGGNAVAHMVTDFYRRHGLTDGRSSRILDRPRHVTQVMQQAAEVQRVFEQQSRDRRRDLLTGGDGEQFTSVRSE